MKIQNISSLQRIYYLNAGMESLLRTNLVENHLLIIEKQQIEHYGLVTSIRVWYVDILEIEYGITDERWVSLPLDEGTRQVMADGIRILFERGNILSQHESKK
jgi:hypothetical protein